MTDLSFECCWCNAINWIDANQIEDEIGANADPLLCWRCSKINIPNSIKKSSDAANYLECINYRETVKDFLTRIVTINGVTHYISADGRPMTRTEFIAEYDTDPANFATQRMKVHQKFYFGKRSTPPQRSSE
jgi:hypothetical protein